MISQEKYENIRDDFRKTWANIFSQKEIPIKDRVSLIANEILILFLALDELFLGDQKDNVEPDFASFLDQKVEEEKGDQSLKFIYDEFGRTEFNEVISSNIARIGYNLEKQKLYVDFKKGSCYRYHDVPQEIWNNFSDSESKGKFFHDNIDEKFEFEKMDLLV